MNTRIKAIADAATLLFLRQGYAKTQISHIAKAIGVSVGTIYLDFSGKKEIMHFILKQTIDPDFMDKEFERPITDELFTGIENEIAALFEQTANEFSNHLENDAANYNFKLLLSDAFDLLARYAVGCLFIEKNQFEFKFLAEHYKNYRIRFLDVMTDYLKIFVKNEEIRAIDNLELSTVFITEILTWWAMDRRYTSFEITDVSLAMAKEICMDNILMAYKK